MTNEQNIIEQEIISIIEDYRPDQYDEVIAKRDEWGLFYHLSSLRTALLCWYPFRQDWHVLEPGAGFGALTGCLAERCASVTALEKNPARAAACRKRHANRENLQVLETELLSLPAGTRYDCIVLVDQLEKAGGRQRELLAACREHLKPEGVLLVSYQNRFGLKYLCGATDHRQRRPFANLDAYGSKLLSRREADALAQEAGFAEAKYYYPMPDAFFAQAVYTDSVRERESIRDRVFAYDPFYSARVAQENGLYDSVVHEDLLPRLASSYLVAYRMTPSTEPAVEFALLSADRGAEHGYATVGYEDGRVEKRAVWPEGVPALRQAFENLETLAGRGVLTVPQTWTDGAIRMPMMKEEALLEDIRRRAAEGPEAVMAVFEELREDILRSSPSVEADPARCGRDWKLPPEKLGPILAEGLIDMIPYNAFRAADGIRFYDQEFRVEHCPVNYVLFRAVFYTWMHIPALEQVLPQKEIQARLGLTESWAAFAAREKEFVDANRNRARYQQVYRWADWADAGARQEKNRALLAGKAGSNGRAEQLESVHRVQLELLHKLDAVCREQGLHYFAIHGTLLGAVRHRGIIPWDDDVDIAMPRADYDRLLAGGRQFFAEPYVLQAPSPAITCFYGGYAKLRRSGTAAIEEQNRGVRCHQGIWIDILPLDVCPEEPSARRHLQRRITFWQRLMLAKLYRPGSGVLDDVDPRALSFYYLFASVLRRRWILKRLDRLFRSGGRSGPLSVLACYYGRRRNGNVYPQEAFAGAVTMPFEDFEIPVPAGYDGILARRYGSRYRELPGRDGRYAHTRVIFSAEHSWEELLRAEKE